MNAIETERLTKRYKDVTAVDGLSLTVGQGEFFSLLGVNGAGKSTTIQMLCTLTRPTSGDARLMGHCVQTDAAGVKAIIGVSPQETAVAPHLTVWENLSLMGGLHCFPKEKSRSESERLMAQMGLETVRNKRAGRLSGGYQRRLSIAMALVTDPQILFLDEPTLGLDVLAREEMWQVIRGLRGRTTVVLTTHYLEEAEALSDRIGIMGGGRLLRLGTAAELTAQTGEASFERAFVKIAREGLK